MNLAMLSGLSELSYRDLEEPPCAFSIETLSLLLSPELTQTDREDVWKV